MPLPVTNDFLRVQDAYLQEEIRQKGITTLSALEFGQKKIIFMRYYHAGDVDDIVMLNAMLASPTCIGHSYLMLSPIEAASAQEENREAQNLAW